MYAAQALKHKALALKKLGRTEEALEAMTEADLCESYWGNTVERYSSWGALRELMEK